MSEKVRVRIDLARQEVEFEGPEPFVERYADKIDAMLERLMEDLARDAVPEGEAPPAGNENRVDLGPFGSYLHLLPNSATEVDKMLAAGYYLEQQSADGTFATADANKRLAEHGIKIGNPSQCVRQSLMAKRVFTFTRGRYKVAEDGRRYLQRLTNGAIKA